MSGLESYDTVARCDKPVEMELLHPVTGEGTGQFIGITGRDGYRFQNAVKASVTADMKKAAALRKKGTKLAPDTADDRINSTCDMLAAASVTFRCDPVRAVKAVKANPDKGIEAVAAVEGQEGGAFLRYKGNRLVYSEDNAAMLYREQKWAREQVDAWVGNLSLFFRD